MSSNLCPECKSILSHKEGCFFCLNCGWSEKVKFCTKLNFEIQQPAAWCPHFLNKKVVNATAAIHAGMCGLCEYCEGKENEF